LLSGAVRIRVDFVRAGRDRLSPSQEKVRRVQQRDGVHVQAVDQRCGADPQTCSNTVRLIFPIHPIHGSGEDVSVTIERRDRLRPRERKREQSGVLTGVRRPCTGVFWDTISCSKAAPPASWLAQWVGVGCIAFEVSLALCWGDAMQAAARSLTRRRTTRMRRRSELVAVREELPR
jgi:hypothetical protein